LERRRHGGAGQGCGREGQLQGDLQRGGQRRFPKHALRWHRLQIQYQLQAHLCSGKISGSWRETTYDASGSVSGTAVGNAVHSIINCAKSSGRMSINVSGSSRSISIVQLDPNRPQHGRIARPHTGDSPILS
jgi:hypothetical protein